MGLALCLTCLPESKPAFRQEAAAFLPKRSRELGWNLPGNLVSASSEMLFVVTCAPTGSCKRNGVIARSIGSRAVEQSRAISGWAA